nr:hypothetical protein [Tanacetum cinerariifolium]
MFRLFEIIDYVFVLAWHLTSLQDATPLCYDDTHDVTPRVSALAGCDTGCRGGRGRGAGGVASVMLGCWVSGRYWGAGRCHRGVHVKGGCRGGADGAVAAGWPGY